MDAKRVAAYDQALAAFTDAMVGTKAILDAALKNGFTRSEAFTLSRDYFRITLSGALKQNPMRKGEEG